MPVVILHDASIAHPGIAEDALQDAKRPLHLGSHSRLGPVLALLDFIHSLLGLHAPIGHVLRLGRGPHGSPSFVPDNPHRPRLCSPRRAANRAAYACHVPRPPTCRPSAPRLLCYRRRYAPWHRSSTGCPSWSDASGDHVLLAVLGRRGSRDDGGINNRAPGYANAFAVQIPIHRIEYLSAKLVLFKQMAKVQDGRLVGRGGATQIDSGEAAQRGRIIERILGTGIGEIEPVLQKVDAQHDRQADRLATGCPPWDSAARSVLPTRAREPRLPWVLRKLLTAAGPRMLFKTRLAGECYLAHRDLHPLTIRCKHGASR